MLDLNDVSSLQRLAQSIRDLIRSIRLILCGSFGRDGRALQWTRWISFGASSTLGADKRRAPKSVDRARRAPHQRDTRRVTSTCPSRRIACPASSIVARRRCSAAPSRYSSSGLAGNAPLIGCSTVGTKTPNFAPDQASWDVSTRRSASGDVPRAASAAPLTRPREAGEQRRASGGCLPARPPAPPARCAAGGARQPLRCIRERPLWSWRNRG